MQRENLQLRENRDLSLKHLLADYVGQLVGINALDPGKMQCAVFIDVQADHFTVELEGLRVAVPYHQIVKILTAPAGVVKLGFFQGQYSMVIRTFDFVVYKGAIGVGISMPV